MQNGNPPTKQQLDLLQKAAVAARNTFLTLSELKTLLAFAAASPSTAMVALADFSNPATSGSMLGIDPAALQTFLTAATTFTAMVEANNFALAKAFAIMAELA